MSVLVERLIATRDRLKALTRQGEDYIWRPAKDAVDALADAANAITERDETIFHLRNQMEAIRAATASPARGHLHRLDDPIKTQPPPHPGERKEP